MAPPQKPKYAPGFVPESEYVEGFVPEEPSASGDPPKPSRDWISMDQLWKGWDSAKGAVGDIASVVMHPVDTATNIGKLAAGTVQLAIPGEQGYEAYPKAVGEQYKQRYGGWENIKDTLYNDPVGAFADIGTLAGGGVGVLRASAKGAGLANRVAKSGKIAGAIKRTEELANQASHYANVLDPLSVAVPMVGQGIGIGAEWAGLKGMGRAIGGPRGSMNKMSEAWQMTEGQLRDYLAKHSDKRGTAPTGEGVLKLRDIVNDANVERVGLERAAEAGGATVDAQKAATQTARDLFSTPARANNPDLSQPLPAMRVGSNPNAKAEAAKAQMRVYTTNHPSLTKERGWGLRTKATGTELEGVDYTASQGDTLAREFDVTFDANRGVMPKPEVVPGESMLEGVEFGARSGGSVREGIDISPYFDTRRTPDRAAPPTVAGQNVRAINAETVDSYGPNAVHPEAANVSKAEAKNLSAGIQEATKPFVPAGKDDWATLGHNMHDDLNLLEALRQRAYNSQQSPIRLYEFLGALKGDPAIMALGASTRPAPLWWGSRGLYRGGKAAQDVNASAVADALRAALLGRMAGQGQ